MDKILVLVSLPSEFNPLSNFKPKVVYTGVEKVIASIATTQAILDYKSNLI